MRPIPKIDWQYNGLLLHEDVKPLEDWANEAKNEIERLNRGIEDALDVEGTPSIHRILVEL